MKTFTYRIQSKWVFVRPNLQTHVFQITPYGTLVVTSLDFFVFTRFFVLTISTSTVSPRGVVSPRELHPNGLRQLPGPEIHGCCPVSELQPKDESSFVLEPDPPGKSVFVKDTSLNPSYGVGSDDLRLV